MSEPTDPREIRHNAGIVGADGDIKYDNQRGPGAHTFGLNPVPPSENGQHHHSLTPNGDAWRLQENAEKFPGLIHEEIANHLRNMDPQTIRERHLRLTMPRTSFDRDQARQQRAEFAVRMQQTTSRDQETLRQRCLAILRSLEHMEVDKDIALLALEKLCGVDD